MSGRSHDARRATRVEKFRRRPKDSGARAAPKQSSKAGADLLIMLLPTPRPSQEAAMISFTDIGKHRQVDVPLTQPLLLGHGAEPYLIRTTYGGCVLLLRATTSYG